MRIICCLMLLIMVNTKSPIEYFHFSDLEPISAEALAGMNDLERYSLAEKIFKLSEVWAPPPSQRGGAGRKACLTRLGASEPECLCDYALTIGLDGQRLRLDLLRSCESAGSIADFLKRITNDDFYQALRTILFFGPGYKKRLHEAKQKVRKTNFNRAVEIDESVESLKAERSQILKEQSELENTIKELSKLYDDPTDYPDLLEERQKLEDELKQIEEENKVYLELKKKLKHLESLGKSDDRDQELGKVNKEISAELPKYNHNNTTRTWGIERKMKEISGKIHLVINKLMLEKHPDELKRLDKIPGLIKEIELEIDRVGNSKKLLSTCDTKDEAERAVLPKEEGFAKMFQMLRLSGFLGRILEEYKIQIQYLQRKLSKENLLAETRANIKQLQLSIDATTEPEARRDLENQLREIDNGILSHMGRLRESILLGQIRVLEGQQAVILAELNRLEELLDGNDGTMGGSSFRVDTFEEIQDKLHNLMQVRDSIEQEIKSTRSEGFTVFWKNIDSFIKRISEAESQASSIRRSMIGASIEVPTKPFNDRTDYLLEDKLSALKTFLEQLEPVIQGSVRGAHESVQAKGTEYLQDLLYPFGFSVESIEKQDS